MDKTNNLQYFLTDIADAIREKKGTSDLINAQNFADEIRNMPQSGEGGGSDGTGRDIEYFSVANNESAGELIFLMSLVKLDYSGDISILTSAAYLDVMDRDVNLIAIGIDMTLPIAMDGVKTTPREWFESNGFSDLSIFGWTPITEEEFYNLNA